MTPSYYTTPHGDLYDLMIYAHGARVVLQHMELALLEYAWRLSRKGQPDADLAKIAHLTARIQQLREQYGEECAPLTSADIAVRLSAEGYMVYAPDQPLPYDPGC